MDHLESEIDNILSQYKTELLELQKSSGIHDTSFATLEESFSSKSRGINKLVFQTLVNKRGKEKLKKKECKSCGKPLRLVDTSRPRKLKSTLGDISFKGRYYHCGGCKKGFYPSLGNRGSSFTPLLKKHICLMAQASPFEEASDILNQILGVQVSPDSVERVSEEIGLSLFNEELFMAKSHKFDASGGTPCGDIVYIQADGAMVNTTNEPEHWRENKLGIVFKESDVKKSGNEENMRISIEKKDIVSSLAQGVEDFENRMKYMLIRSETYWAKNKVIITDGAVWLENMFKRLLPGCTHILDWFHAAQHVYNTAKKMWGERSTEGKEWSATYIDLLWNGKVDEVLEMLSASIDKFKEQTSLIELYNYFKSRTHMMRYKEFRDAGYCIGSGSIESANKHVVLNRLKRSSSMKWTINGANAIAHLRAQYQAKNWDSVSEFIAA